MNENNPLDQHLAQENATKRSVLKWKAIQAEEQIEFAQKTLFIIVLLNAIGLFLSWGKGNPVESYLNIGITIIYLICGIFAKKYPILCMSIASVIFLIPNLLLLFFAPQFFTQGILWKGVLFLALSIGLYNAVKRLSCQERIRRNRILNVSFQFKKGVPTSFKLLAFLFENRIVIMKLFKDIPVGIKESIVVS